MNALFDTNIVVDALKGIEAAFDELELYNDCLISRITWIEILVGAQSAVEDAAFRDYLTKFSIRELDGKIAERAVALRRKHNLKVPDAIIWATAEEYGYILVTRNTKDFPPGHPGIRFPYRV